MKNLSISFIIFLFSFTNAWADVKELNNGSFEFSHQLVLPGTPEVIYDAITGDISGWWDHSFSKTPLHFYIEAKPGGRFLEIFDEAGNGVLHATVLVADRGKMLRFDGPLGLSGRAVKMVHTYKFKAIGSDSTHLELSVHISGEIDKELANTVEKVWYHFLFEQFKPFVEQGKHQIYPFEDDAKWGYKNEAGKMVIDSKYLLANEFNTYGIASVLDESGWAYIDKEGKIIMRPFIIDNGPDYWSDGVARFIEGGKIGFMDEKGIKVVKATLDFALPFSEGLAAFCTGCNQVQKGEYHQIEGGKWGYINKTGEIVVNPEYDKAGPFRNGEAEVSLDGKEIILKKEDITE
jgi:hypothetical protein